MKTEYPNFVPLVTPSKGFEELQKLIIDVGLCSQCGACVALCKRLELSENGPQIIEGQECNLNIGAIKCSEDGSCYDACPLVPFVWEDVEKQVFGKTAEDKELGNYMEIVAVRSKDPEVLEKAQDGGAVTSFLIAGLQKEILDGAVVASGSTEWSPEAKIATSREEIIAAAGTKYSRVPMLRLTVEPFNQGLRKLAYIGTGCQQTALRKLQLGSLKNVPNIDLSLIGLFCFENFPYKELKDQFKEVFGVEMSDIQKQDISKGKFILKKTDGSEVQEKVGKFDTIVPKICNYCTNFTSKFSDLSVGSIGSADGWSTVIVRTQKGKDLLETTRSLGLVDINEKDVNIDQIRRSIELKTKKRTKIEGSDPYTPNFG